MKIYCDYVPEEYMEVSKKLNLSSVVFEINAPSQTEMGENGQVVLTIESTKKLINVLQGLVEEN